MSDSDRVLSPALLAANQNLHTRREQHREEQGDVMEETVQTAVSPITPTAIATLPPHLGWESVPATAVIRNAHARKSKQPITQTAVTEPIKIETAVSTPKPQPSTVKLYPSIGLGMLRQEQAAPGRVWLLARHLDREGSGKLRIAVLRETLTIPTAPLRICGWRQLRNLLRQGDGIFWHRDKTHIWLYSAAKAAHALDVTRLSGHPVSVPLSALTGGIGDVRAHLYAAFHSGRVNKNERDGVAVMPIARETLTAVSSISPVTQRKYEAQTNVNVQHNFAIGEAANKENVEARAWQHGGSAFILKDTRGQHGSKGKKYIAWQLPNTYGNTHQQRPLGRQKRINRELKDLVMKGMPGNVEETNDTQMQKRYYANGKAATMDSYWFRKKGGNGRYAIWHTM